MAKKLHLFLLTLAPAIFAFFVIDHRVGPEGTGFVMDPDWIYVFNGLLVATGENVFITQHPGTPVALLCGLFIKLKWIFFSEGSSDVVFDLIKNPGSYYTFIGNGFLLINTLALFLFGFYFWKKKVSIYAVLLAQSSVLWFSQVILFSGRGLPEGITLTLGLLLSSFWSLTIIKDKDPSPLLWGGSLGIACATKLNFLPLSFFFLALKKFSSLPKYLLVTVFAFLLSTLYIGLDRQIELLSYFANFFTHKGLWGSGERGIPSISELLVNYHQFWGEDSAAVKLYFAILLFSLFVFAISIAFKLKERWKLGIHFLVLFLIFCATIKHPGARYLMPGFVLFPALIIVLFTLKLPTWIKWLPIIILGVFFFTRFSAYKEQIINMKLTKLALNYESKIIEEQLAKNLNCPLLMMQASNFNKTALFFGNYFSGEQFSSQLSQLYSNHWAHGIERDEAGKEYISIMGYTTKMSLPKFKQHLKKTDCLLFLGWSDPTHQVHKELFPERNWETLFSLGPTLLSLSKNATAR